jgi:hypothetical protein
MSDQMLNGQNILAIFIKATATGTIYSVGYKYLNKVEWNDYNTLLRAFAGSAVSSLVSELLVQAIVKRILSTGNSGIKTIVDQGLGAAMSAGINIYANKLMILDTSDLQGVKFYNHEEFLLQAASDVGGEIITQLYLVPLLGIDLQAAANTFT